MDEDITTQGVAKEQKTQEKRKPYWAKADMFSVIHMHSQEPDAPTEGWAMTCTKKKRPKKQKALPPVSEVKACTLQQAMPPSPKEKAVQPVSVEVQAMPDAPKKAMPDPCRNTWRAQKAKQNSV